MGKGLDHFKAPFPLLTLGAMETPRELRATCPRRPGTPELARQDWEGRRPGSEDGDAFLTVSSGRAPETLHPPAAFPHSRSLNDTHTQHDDEVTAGTGSHLRLLCHSPSLDTLRCSHCVSPRDPSYTPRIWFHSHSCHFLQNHTDEFLCPVGHWTAPAWRARGVTGPAGAWAALRGASRPCSG